MFLMTLFVDVQLHIFSFFCLLIVLWSLILIMKHTSMTDKS